MGYRSKSSYSSYAQRRRVNMTSFSARRNERKSQKKLIFAIIGALIFGYTLLMWILPAFISGVSVLNRFKSGTSTNVATEDTAIAPPVFNLPYEATSTSRINIPGYTLPHTKVELYIDEVLKDTQTSGDDGSFTFNSIELSLGKNNIYGKTLDDKGTKSLPSKTITITLDNSKPILEIEEPQDGITVKENKITIRGKVSSGESVKVDINGIKVIIGSDGSFNRSYNLNEGENTIAINATDTAGNTTQVSKTVYFQPDPSPTPTPGA